MLGVVGMLLGDLISRSVGPIWSALLLAGAIVVLRSRDLPLFSNNSPCPALLVGGGSSASACSAMPARPAVRCCSASSRWAWRRRCAAWLRVLLGAACPAAGRGAHACTRWYGGLGAAPRSPWLAWHLLLAAWLIAHVLVGSRLRG